MNSKFTHANEPQTDSSFTPLEAGTQMAKQYMCLKANNDNSPLDIERLLIDVVIAILQGGKQRKFCLVAIGSKRHNEFVFSELGSGERFRVCLSRELA